MGFFIQLFIWAGMVIDFFNEFDAFGEKNLKID